MKGKARDEKEDEERGGKKIRADCGTESGRGRRTGRTGERGSTTTPATPDDGKSQR